MSHLHQCCCHGEVPVDTKPWLPDATVPGVAARPICVGQALMQPVRYAVALPAQWRVHKTCAAMLTTQTRRLYTLTRSVIKLNETGCPNLSDRSASACSWLPGKTSAWRATPPDSNWTEHPTPEMANADDEALGWDAPVVQPGAACVRVCLPADPYAQRKTCMQAIRPAGGIQMMHIMAHPGLHGC